MLRSVIQAGFGNQLFQYATAYALAKEKNQSLELDVSWFSWINNQKNQTFRVNNLDKLNLDCNTFVDNGYSKYRLLTKFKFLKNTKVNGKKVPFILENMMACRENQSYLFDKITTNSVNTVFTYGVSSFLSCNIFTGIFAIIISPFLYPFYFCV